MTTPSREPDLRLEEHGLAEENAGPARPGVRRAALLAGAGLALGFVAACTSTSPGGQPSSSTSPPPTTATASTDGSGVPSQEPSESAACTQFQASKTTLLDTWQRYTAGQASLPEVAAAVTNLAAAAKTAGESSSAALRAQAEDVGAAARSFDSTLSASPPPTKQEVEAAGQNLLNAVKALQLPCSGSSQ